MTDGARPSGRRSGRRGGARRTRARRSPSATSRARRMSASARSRRRSTTAAACKPETRAKVIAVAKELGFRPNDLAQSLHRGQTFTVGLITSDSLRPLLHPDHGGAGGVPRRQPHRRSSCATPPTIRSARRGTSTRSSASASTASWSPAGAPTARQRLDVHGAEYPGALRLLAVGRAGRLLPRARRRGRRGACGRAPDRARPEADRAYHRAGAVRGRAAPPRRLPQGACSARGLAGARGLLSPRRVVGGMGPRGGRQALRDADGMPPDAIFCGNDQIARGVDRRAPRARHRRSRRRLDRRLRQLGDRRRQRRARRSPSST